MGIKQEGKEKQTSDSDKLTPLKMSGGGSGFSTTRKEFGEARRIPPRRVKLEVLPAVLDVLRSELLRSELLRLILPGTAVLGAF